MWSCIRSSLGITLTGTSDRGAHPWLPVTVLASLVEEATMSEILADFPSLTEADVRAVIAFAAASAEEDLPVPAIPVPR